MATIVRKIPIPLILKLREQGYALVDAPDDAEFLRRADAVVQEVKDDFYARVEWHMALIFCSDDPDRMARCLEPMAVKLGWGEFAAKGYYRRWAMAKKKQLAAQATEARASGSQH
jgi:hypothetical protein